MLAILNKKRFSSPLAGINYLRLIFKKPVAPVIVLYVTFVLGWSIIQESGENHRRFKTNSQTAKTAEYLLASPLEPGPNLEDASLGLLICARFIRSVGLRW